MGVLASSSFARASYAELDPGTTQNAHEPHLVYKKHYVAVCRIQDRITDVLLPILAGAILEVGAAALGARLGGISGLSLGWIIAVCVEAMFMFRLVLRKAFLF
jgi:hypothetical protein